MAEKRSNSQTPSPRPFKRRRISLESITVSSHAPSQTPSLPAVKKGLIQATCLEASHFSCTIPASNNPDKTLSASPSPAPEPYRRSSLPLFASHDPAATKPNVSTYLPVLSSAPKQPSPLPNVPSLQIPHHPFPHTQSPSLGPTVPSEPNAEPGKQILQPISSSPPSNVTTGQTVSPLIAYPASPLTSTRTTPPVHPLRSALSPSHLATPTGHTIANRSPPPAPIIPHAPSPVISVERSPLPPAAMIPPLGLSLSPAQIPPMNWRSLTETSAPANPSEDPFPSLLMFANLDPPSSVRRMPKVVPISQLPMPRALLRAFRPPVPDCQSWCCTLDVGRPFPTSVNNQSQTVRPRLTREQEIHPSVPR